MKMVICALSAAAVAGFVPQTASAADLGGGYDDRETIVEESPPVVERERVIERRYYEPRYYEADEPVVTYYEHRYPRPFPYYASYYYPYRHDPYHRWGHRVWARDYRW